MALSKEEIDRAIAEHNTIWGIEGMAPLSREEEAITRKFLAGEMTKDEYRMAFLEALDHDKI